MIGFHAGRRGGFGSKSNKKETPAFRRKTIKAGA
jgi:hypothetical protein